ncbi:hypothetical protein P154DRAFT_154606 [Amniculicola lignicola CBS 123094]|uniref:Uncharacterized protein n=1 Tax=Amniculicola lignicola CBS 123094 TaxID=1392246 RepID=A0A6A5WJM4_9PLEO|nr:hypothetical protein P154DRAFT_154606 [Amniculicola lignicola CBS 123094]
MGDQRPFSRASSERQSQVRGGGMRTAQGLERGNRVPCNRCRRLLLQARKHPNNVRNLAIVTTLLERPYITTRWRPISWERPLHLPLLQVPLIRSLEAQNIGAAQAFPPHSFRAPVAGHCGTGHVCTHGGWHAGLSAAPSCALGGTSRLDVSKTDRTLEAKAVGCITSAYSGCTAWAASEGDGERPGTRAIPTLNYRETCSAAGCSWARA